MIVDGSWQVSVVLVSCRPYLLATWTFVDCDGSVHHRGFHHLRRHNHQEISQQA